MYIFQVVFDSSVIFYYVTNIIKYFRYRKFFLCVFSVETVKQNFIKLTLYCIIISLGLLSLLVKGFYIVLVQFLRGVCYFLCNLKFELILPVTLNFDFNLFDHLNE